MTRSIFRITVLTLFIVGCNSKSTKDTKQGIPELIYKQDSIDKFWKWFESNEKNLRSFQSNPEKLADQIYDNLKKIESGLAIGFYRPKNNIIKLTISANDNRDLFPVVQKIVEKAPKIYGWTFVAFIQRTPIKELKGSVYKAQGVELILDKMKFYPLASGDSLDLIIYADNVTEENFNQIASGGHLLVEDILGEYDCVTKVRKYNFQNMPTKQKDLKGLMPLLDLAKYVDNFHKSMHN